MQINLLNIQLMNRHKLNINLYYGPFPIIPKFINIMNRQTNLTTIFQKCLKNLTVLFDNHNVDESHDIKHVLKVVEHARQAILISPVYLSQEVKENILLASLLHEADDYKIFPLSKNYQNAKIILKKESISEQRIQNIVQMIDLVSFSKNGDQINQNKPEWIYYPRYSDRIEAAGVVNLRRVYIYAQKVNNPVSTQRTCKPSSIQEVIKCCQGRKKLYIERGGVSQSIIDHVFDKLLHIELPKYIKNAYFLDKFEACWNQLADFVIQHAKTDYQNVQFAILKNI